MLGATNYSGPWRAGPSTNSAPEERHNAAHGESLGDRLCALHRRHTGPALSVAGQRRSEKVYDGVDMSLASPAYFEIIDFIAGGTTAEAVAHFRPSSEAQQRVAKLIKRERATVLSPEERAELDHFMELEHILRMAKARAQQMLSRGQ